MATKSAVEIKNVNIYYGETHAVKDINMDFPDRTVTALIGPSGCGKSTLLRSINRMNDLIDGAKVTGQINIHGKNILDPDVSPVALRTKVGMVFQKPVPFQKSIYENIAFAPRYKGITNKEKLNEIVENSLKKTALWEEVKDRLHSSAFGLSGGQQQRLVIARAIAMNPEIILLDEPASALDPISTLKVEELIDELKKDYTIIIVTHNMHQAARISDYTAFFYMGELIEYNVTSTLFTNPTEKKTEEYISGRFG